MQAPSPNVLVLLGLLLSASSAVASPEKAPEVTTVGTGPGVITPGEIAKIEALARAFPHLGFRIPSAYEGLGFVETPSIRIEHFAESARGQDQATRAPYLGTMKRSTARRHAAAAGARADKAGRL